MTDPAMAVEPIRLVYSVNDADQRAAIRAIVLSEPQVRWMRITALVLPLAMIALSLLSGWSLGLALARNVFWIILALLFVLIYVPLTVRSVINAMRRADPEWEREQAVTIGAEGIRIASPAETSEIPWGAVRRANETRDVVLIHMGARILYVPKRILAARGDPAVLRRLLRAKLGADAHLTEDVS